MYSYVQPWSTCTVVDVKLYLTYSASSTEWNLLLLVSHFPYLPRVYSLFIKTLYNEHCKFYNVLIKCLNVDFWTSSHADGKIRQELLYFFAFLNSYVFLFLISRILTNCSYIMAVLRIQDILGRIRIRIRGSMPLTNESGSWIRILLFSSLTFKMPAKN